ncbi:MAG: hypothetical protein GY865_05490 [candidate division Zixibacteria bacterium]|nr:hypothetical protein [candidate division Zixibacteria bacterium]
MSKLTRLFLFLTLIFVIIISSVFGMEFGNVAVFVDKSTITDIQNISIQLDGDPDKYSLDDKNKIIIWNIHPGVHRLNLLDHDGSMLNHISVNVFPNLSNKIVLSIKNNQFVISDNGFVDQAGHIFTFTQDEMQNIPGELSDGLGLLGSVNNTNYDYSFGSPYIAWGSQHYSRTTDFSQLTLSTYNYDGLLYLSNSDFRTLAPSSSTAPDLAIVNLSDPFGGYGNSEISLISNFNKPNQFKTETVIGERDRKFYRGTAGYKLPNSIGSIFGSVSIENLADAFPNSNVEGILPHNSLDNSEFTIGAGFNISQDIKSDFRMFYHSYRRDIYDHQYYFNQLHAPREEGYLYRGKLSIYGKLPIGLFFDAGLELSGDENETGDGLYFDDIESYQRPNWPGSGNPAYDATGLFWSWDNIEGETPDIDEAHVFDDYNRERSRGWKTNIGLTTNISNSTQLSLDAVYSGSSFRRLQYLFPANRDTFNLVNIGFDRLGNKIKMDGLTEVPEPNFWEISFGAKHITEIYSVIGVIDYLRFNANVLTVKDIYNPLGYDGLDSLELSDLTRAKLKSKIALRFAGYFILRKNLNLFTNFSIKYYPPANRYLFNDYDYLDRKIDYGGYYYVLSYPELDFEQNRIMELGVSVKQNENYFSLSYRNEKSDNLIASTIITNANPHSYSMYLNQATGTWGSSDAIILSFQRKGDNFFNCSIAASLMNFDFEDKRLVGIGRFEPATLYNRPLSTMQKLLSSISFDLAFQYIPGILYTPYHIQYDPVTAYAISSTPAGAFNSRRAKDFLELNVGVTANVLKFAGGSLTFRGEVINVLNRENHLNIWSTSGSPDETGWLNTESGEDFIENNNAINDSSGLTGVERYILASNNPNNFGRPRMFRIIARLEF